MPADDPIPSFLELQQSRVRGSRRPGKAPDKQAQMALGLGLDPVPATPEQSAAPVAAVQIAAEMAAVVVTARVVEPVPVPVPEPLREPVLYSVRELIREVRQRVEGAYRGLIHVEGEVSNCRPAASGHLYFTLKDGDAQLPVVMFRREAGLIGFKLKDGLAVELRGRLSVYESRGQLQMIAETMRPRGAGALRLQFEQMRDRLRLEGLFDSARKRPLPPFPHCIGVVTSPRGAALHDIIHVVRRRHARLNLLIYPAVMQGAQCPGSVAAGVRWFNRNPERVDLILIARGGGSLEDLAGFNDEALARVIAASELPVITGIGHEIDETIADFVADLRAPTPSAAAELITAAQHRIEERIAGLARRVERGGQYHVLAARQRFQRLSAQYVLGRLRDAVQLRGQRVDELGTRAAAAFARRMRQRALRLAQLETRLRRQDPGLRLAAAQRRLSIVSGRLEQVAAGLVTRRTTRVAHATARLEALSPLAVLGRGYAIVYVESTGAILREPTEAPAGTALRARLARGTVRAVVQAEESGKEQ